MKKTINELLVLTKMARERLNDLKTLRSEVYKKERYYMGDKEKLVEPLFDVEEVDSKIVDLQSFILEVDQKIKVSNSKISLEVVFDKELFSGVKRIKE